MHGFQLWIECPIVGLWIRTLTTVPALVSSGCSTIPGTTVHYDAWYYCTVPGSSRSSGAWCCSAEGSSTWFGTVILAPRRLLD